MHFVLCRKPTVNYVPLGSLCLLAAHACSDRYLAPLSLCTRERLVHCAPFIFCLLSVVLSGYLSTFLPDVYLTVCPTVCPAVCLAVCLAVSIMDTFVFCAVSCWHVSGRAATHGQIHVAVSCGITCHISICCSSLGKCATGAARGPMRASV